MRKFSKGLVGLTFLISSCSANTRDAGLKKTTRRFYYDEVSMEMADTLYSMDHNGEQAQSADQLSPYRYSSVDINDNGVLDYKIEFTVTRKGTKVVEVYQKTVFRAQANGTGRDAVQEDRLVVNDNGTYTVYSKETNFSPNEDRINDLAQSNDNRDQQMQRTEELIRQLLSAQNQQRDQ